MILFPKCVMGEGKDIVVRKTSGQGYIKKRRRRRKESNKEIKFIMP